MKIVIIWNKFEKWSRIWSKVRIPPNIIQVEHYKESIKDSVILIYSVIEISEVFNI